MSRHMISHHQCNLAHHLLRPRPSVQKSSSQQSSTIKVLFILPPCPLMRREGFSIELFGVQNNSANAVLTASKVPAGTFILQRERELLSLSLGLTQVSCNSEHQCCQSVDALQELFTHAHLCGIPPALGLHFVRIKDISIFCLSSFSWVTTDSGLRCSLIVDSGNMSIKASLERFKSSENLPIHLTISIFPLLAQVI